MGRRKRMTMEMIMVISMKNETTLMTTILMMRIMRMIMRMIMRTMTLSAGSSARWEPRLASLRCSPARPW